MTKPLGWAAYGLGWAAVAWVGAGYLGSNPLALAVTGLIAAVYAAGGLELRRFDRATANLDSALAALPDTVTKLGDWLAGLDPSLRQAVRLRIEGERVALPGPALTPYLLGLLVLLGMLGTFLGMVVTLQGAVLALESTTDLPTIRAALTAPVKGLGLAFGTSIAGVAASAMLGLVSALCRRARLRAARRLDGRIATTLRPFSLAHQREAAFQSLQSQAQALPELVGQVQAAMAQMVQQGQALNERLLAGQDDFHRRAGTAYTELAASVDRTLRQSLTESARLAGATIQPVVEATMAGIARESSALHGQLAGTVEAQLAGLSERLDHSVGTVSTVWTGALARHEQTSDGLQQGLQRTLAQFSETFEQRSAALLASVSATHAATQGELQAAVSALAESGTRQQLALAETLEQRATALLATVGQAQSAWQAEAAARDEQRLAAQAQALAALAASLQQAWQQAGAQGAAHQAQICQTLEQTAHGIHAQAAAHARDTIAEMAGMLQAAAEAPRAAAEAVALLRQQLSDSQVRDNALLEERGRILAALGGLLETVTQATAEQRSAVQALVGSSAQLLEQVGQRFAGQVEAESAKLATVAAQVTGSAVEVSSLGEALGLAVERFSASSEALTGHLQRVEAALGQSLARSDDQLAYYVAQAREIIDLSLLSQRQILDALQQRAGSQAAVAGEPA